MNRTVIGSSREQARAAIRTAGARRRSFMDRMRARRGSGDSGQSLVEFSMVAPVLLLLTFGMCLFGIAFNKYLTLNNAVEIGGQLLADERGYAGDPCAAATTAIENAAPNLTLTNSDFSYNIAGTSYSGTNSCSGTTGMNIGNNAIVTVTYPISFYVPFLGNQSFTLTSQVEEVIQ
jgi:Flp pilus assembly protein TadG